MRGCFIRILHDYDEPHLRSYYAIKRGLKLLLYGVCKRLGLRLTIIEPIYNEVREYADTLIKLDKLVGVTSVMGIRDKVQEHYPEIMEELSEYCVDLRTHIHIGDIPDPNRIRTWEPINKLENITSNVWHYDTDYVMGQRPKLKDGEIPIWHIDRPHFLKHYINFLYEVLVEEMEL